MNGKLTVLMPLSRALKRSRWNLRRSQAIFRLNSPSDRITFALQHRKRGPAFCPPEKRLLKWRPGGYAVHFLWSHSMVKIAEFGRYTRFSAETQPFFSALQTAWRSERDSNPRYFFRETSKINGRAMRSCTTNQPQGKGSGSQYF